MAPGTWQLVAALRAVRIAVLDRRCRRRDKWASVVG